MPIPDAAVGSILAALIGGLVVFISTVLSKEQKTSEFRQTWIDEIRKDISQYIAGTTEVVTLNSAKSKLGKDEQIKFIDENFKLIHELQTLEHRILLRLNPKEHQSLIDAILKIRPALVLAHKNGNSSLIEHRLVERLREEARYVLKEEWSRVKRGEPAFRLVKISGITLVLVSALFALYIFFSDSKREIKTENPIHVEVVVKQTAENSKPEPRQSED